MTASQTSLFDTDEGSVPVRHLAAWSGGIAAFGFALGTYAGIGNALLATWKVPLVILLSVLITLPTLAVLTAVTGGSFSLRRSAYLAALTTAYVGALLLALAPVMWLFATSSWFLGWSVVVALGLGLVALLTASLRILSANRAERKAYILWALLLIPVTLQMVTSLRPVVTPRAPRGEQRMFFLQHFGEVADFRLSAGETDR